MKTYLIHIYRTKKEKNPFLQTITTAESETEAEKKLIGKVFYSNSQETKILGTCRKAEVIREII
jgi:hypothetical protein